MAEQLPELGEVEDGADVVGVCVGESDNDTLEEGSSLSSFGVPSSERVNVGKPGREKCLKSEVSVPISAPRPNRPTNIPRMSRTGTTVAIPSAAFLIMVTVSPKKAGLLKVDVVNPGTYVTVVGVPVTF